MKSLTALMGIFVLSPTYADGAPLKIVSSTNSQYYIVEKAGTTEQPELVLMRLRRGATSYSRYLYDCETHTTRMLGSAESLEAIANYRRKGDVLPVAEGTIAYQLWRYACGT
jgi:hypothetical protein